MNIREANAEDIEPIASLYVMNWKKTYVGLLPDNFLNGLTVNEGIKKWQEYLNKENQNNQLDNSFSIEISISVNQ